ncbi:RNA polymerase sigma factor [Veillonella montpellierensis]|uniref:RNA polymerase sigma factor n=1 Tax=Veillonella montpellierensis TaxID=187328 RepID=UPI0004238E83|nr:sigma-70 family RNA polymerase sigma factor [Veillonella montpellierensis]
MKTMIGEEKARLMSDRELVAAYRNHIEGALTEICRRYERLVLKYGHNSFAITLGEDLLSEMWMALFEAVEQYDIEGPVQFAGFAMSKIRFANWNFYKRCSRNWEREQLLQYTHSGEESFQEIAWEDIRSLADTEGEALNAMERHDAKRRVMAALGELERTNRYIMYCVFYRGETMAQVAKRMGCTRQAIHYRYKHALEALRNRIGDDMRSEF